MTQTPTDALRLVPCPFCGGDAEQFEMADRAGVRCADIMCAGSHRLPSHGEDYVGAWNRRAAPASPLPGGLPPISLDGPHKIDFHRQWLARQLLDSKLDDDEAYSIVRHDPAIKLSRNGKRE